MAVKRVKIRMNRRIRMIRRNMRNKKMKKLKILGKKHYLFYRVS